MKWGLQHVKVTLEDADSGEVVVIEQRPDGTLICKEGGGSKSARGEDKAANERPKEHAKSAEVKPEAKPKPPKEEAKTAAPPKKDEAKQDEAEKPRRPRESKRSEAKSKPSEKSSKKTLAWKAVKDNNYDGFAAKVRVGVFKALHARNTQWALFFERKDNYPAHLGCFRRLEQAKARAQELHDAGWPEIEFGEVTRELVERACPVPSAEREEERTTMKPKTVTKTEEKAEEKPAAAPQAQAAAANESADAVMMRSFTQVAGSMLADDEDDD